MKLAEWARSYGIHVTTAYRWYKNGTLPVPVTKLASGMIVVNVPDKPSNLKHIVYARVSSSDQKKDLDAQVGRVVAWATANNIAVSGVVTEVGSGVSGHLLKLQKLLQDPEVDIIIVEHRDRLTRFGLENLEMVLRAAGRRIMVMDETEVEDDLVTDMTEVLTSFCAKLYGKRGAKNRADKAMACAKGNV